MGDVPIDTVSDNLLDQFFGERDVSPIYASSFRPYYAETFAHDDIQVVKLVEHSQGRVDAALLGTLRRRGADLTFDYFGNPAILVTAGESVSSISATERIFEKLMMNQAWRDVLHSGNFELSIGPREFELQGQLAQHLAKKSTGMRPHIEGIHSFDGQHRSGSRPIMRIKSVKTALEAADSNGLAVKVIDSTDRHSNISSSLEALRELHFLSAQKRTRPLRSWLIQEELVRQGHGFLVSASLESKTVGASLFMTNQTSHYYGVSAVDRSLPKLSIGHNLILGAISYGERKNAKSLWLGSQLSSLFMNTSEKERGIENFKSYFVNSQSLRLIFTRRTLD